VHLVGPIILINICVDVVEGNLTFHSSHTLMYWLTFLICTNVKLTANYVKVNSTR
jgi:hypothetical protein